MRFFRLQNAVLALSLVAMAGFVANISAHVAFAQETTGGISGTVKDGTGALVRSATVEISGPALIGTKKVETSDNGQYRVVNLPPGSYTVTVTDPGFDTAKTGNVVVQVGRYPTVDISLKVGSAATTIEVTEAGPTIEQGGTHDLTNISKEDLALLPAGASYQSLIALAPAARMEPLNDGGASINGGANSENSYLIDGQDTGNIRTGVSDANVPIELISEFQVKTSGLEAEYQGAISGTVNVVLKKGSNAWHGSLFNYYNSDALSAAPHGYVRYDPAQALTAFDIPTQLYLQQKDHYINEQPGVQVGGAIIQNRLWFSLAAAPNFNTGRRTAVWASPVGAQIFPFSSERLYYNGRLDAQVNSHVRVFGTLLSQYYREAGSSSTATALPNRDSVNGLTNTSVSSAVSVFNSGIGYVAPNLSYNVGADITLTKNLIATTRWGHFFDNTEDRGTQNGPVYVWGRKGSSYTDLQGHALSAALNQASGYQTGALNSIYSRLADKHDQLTQDLEWFKSGRFGSHDFKVGYGLNHLSNDVILGYSGPYVRVYPGAINPASTNTSSAYYATAGAPGAANCATIGASNLTAYGNSGYNATAKSCVGNYGYLRIRDYGTSGSGESFNHGIYLQDGWQLNRQLTVNLGIRFDREYLPPYPQLLTTTNPIDFGWGDKIAPRLGVAWNVLGKNRAKIYASYGRFYDQMKLNLAIDSFGGAFWHDCFYAMYDPDPANNIIPAYGSSGHYCTGAGDANFKGGTVPSTLKFIENDDFRASSAAGEYIDPKLKPYSQHENVFGFEYELTPTWFFTGRWDRRRLDHAIEDAGLLNNGSEAFTIINPGEGVDKDISTFFNFMYGTASPITNFNNIKAARSYDGFEFEAKHRLSHGLVFNASYTYSRLRGNYSGLTSTDLSDGGASRENPNDNRSFDEPYFQFTSHGTSASGRLATDRPNVLKLDGSYSRKWNPKNTTSLGLFQEAFSGSPQSSYMNVDYKNAGTGGAVFVEGRGKWVDITTNSSGAAVFGKVYDRRTPAFFETDANINHAVRLGDNGRSLFLEAIVTNVLNQREVTSLYSQMDSTNSAAYLTTSNISGTSQLDYYKLITPYAYQTLWNTQSLVMSSEYGKPYTYQASRSIRLRIGYRF